MTDDADDETYKMEADNEMCLKTLRGHGKDVTYAIYSPQGLYLATVSEDRTVRVWTSCGDPLALLECPEGTGESGGRAIVFSPDESTLASMGGDTVVLWALPAGDRRAELEGHTGKVTYVSFSSCGTFLATSSEDMTARLWSINGEERQVLKGHTAKVSKAVISPDGALVATAGDTPRLWSSQDGTCVKVLEGGAYDILFSPDGKRLATSGGKEVRVWSMDGECLHQISEDTGMLAFSADSKYLAGNLLDRTLVWCVEDGRRTATLVAGPTFASHELNNVVFSPDGTRVATASWDFNARLYDLTEEGDGEQERKPVGIYRHDAFVWSVEFSPDGRVLVSASGDSSAKLWAAHGFRVSKFLGQSDEDVLRSIDQNQAAASLTWARKHQDLSMLYMAVEQKRALSLLEKILQANPEQAKLPPDGSLILKSPGVGMCLQSLHELTNRGDWADDAVFSPDGTRFLLLPSEDDTDFAPIMMSLSCRPLYKLAEDSFVHKAVFSPDGAFLATLSDDNGLRLWKAGDGELVSNLGDGNHVNFSPDGAFASYTRKEIRIFSVKGELVKVLEGSNIIFSPAGGMFATLVPGADRTEGRLYSTDGECLKELEGTISLESVTFSLDGTTIVVTGCEKIPSADDGGDDKDDDESDDEVEEKIARLYTKNGELVKELYRGKNYIDAARFSPDDSCLAIAVSGQVTLWSFTGERQAGFQCLGRMAFIIGEQKNIGPLEFSPDGATLATATKSGAYLWSAKTGKLVNTLIQGENTCCISWSPDGSMLATGHTRSWYLWSVSGECLKFTKMGWDSMHDVTGFRWSSDSSYVVARSFDAQTVTLYCTTNRFKLAVLLADLPYPPRVTRDVEETEKKDVGQEGEQKWQHGHSWSEFVQQDDPGPADVTLLRKALSSPGTDARSILTSVDQDGNRLQHSASKAFKPVIGEYLYFLGRYDVGAQLHKSATCVVVKAIDTHDSDQTVCLKLMRDKAAFDREVGGRVSAAELDEYVMPVLRSHEIPADQYASKIVAIPTMEDLDNQYCYCVVMVLGDKTLMDVLVHEHVAAHDWLLISKITRDVASGLECIHNVLEKAHCDIKPLNLVRNLKNRRFMIIDMDAATKFGEAVGAKYSSGSLPPEMFHVQTVGEGERQRKFVQTRVPTTNEEEEEEKNGELEKVLSNGSIDAWALGNLLYHMCADCPLFPLNGEYNLVEESDLLSLAQWTNDTKTEKLQKIKNRLARDLVSKLLMRNAEARLSMSQVLAHPFVVEDRMASETFFKSVTDLLHQYCSAVKREMSGIPRKGFLSYGWSWGVLLKRLQARLRTLKDFLLRAGLDDCFLDVDDMIGDVDARMKDNIESSDVAMSIGTPRLKARGDETSASRNNLQFEIDNILTQNLTKPDFLQPLLWDGDSAADAFPGFMQIEDGTCVDLRYEDDPLGDWGLNLIRLIDRIYKQPSPNVDRAKCLFMLAIQNLRLEARYISPEKAYLTSPVLLPELFAQDMKSIAKNESPRCMITVAEGGEQPVIERVKAMLLGAGAVIVEDPSEPVDFQLLFGTLANREGFPVAEVELAKTMYDTDCLIPVMLDQWKWESFPELGENRSLYKRLVHNLILPGDPLAAAAELQKIIMKVCGLTASDVHASAASEVYTEALKSCLLASGGKYGSAEELQAALDMKKLILHDSPPSL